LKIREIVCDSCKLQKNKLYSCTSQLLNIQLKMCESCISSNYEPKHIIMIYMATNGIDEKIQKYLQNHNYYGNKITDKDLKQFDK